MSQLKSYWKKFYYLLGMILFLMTAWPVWAKDVAPQDTSIMKKLISVAAGEGSNDKYTPYATTDVNTLANILGAIIFWFMTLLGLIFLGFMIFAGYLWLTARGNKEQVDKAHQILTQSIVGMAIILGAAAITSLIYLAFVQ